MESFFDKVLDAFKSLRPYLILWDSRFTGYGEDEGKLPCLVSLLGL